MFISVIQLTFENITKVVIVVVVIVVVVVLVIYISEQ